jgi:hypothetical protein
MMANIGQHTELDGEAIGRVIFVIFQTSKPQTPIC